MMAIAQGSPRVHVLGLGSIGTFAAHCLAEVPGKPSITLMFHRKSLLNEYIRNDRRITLKTHEGSTISNGNYALEVLDEGAWYPTTDSVQSATSRCAPATDTIKHLIVCVKATHTVTALRPLLPRLAPYSTIMFLQNGGGMIEDVNRHLFPDPGSRPNYISGVISHGVTTNSPFDITHTGFAATSIGLVPRSMPPRSMALVPGSANSDLLLQTSYLLQELPTVPRFNCKTYAWPDILAVQLEKITTNAFCNPLCALADSSNAYLFTIPETCKALMSEISSVILALPELKGVPGIAERFSAAALEMTVMSIINRTRNTTCSMVWDLRAKRKTEIRYINGFWSRKGREIGILTPINDELIAAIEAQELQYS
ncbi:6-phosphogluconate dehydrogenase C-terminal domain-like protein [Aaosphaeria arxii CBS 175.79]|uniref:2-dehydropantoate 2-reductase n=1 Tax=Aaosphaeria arxii CBS 175.79 TaxID=1450172 RepID=A0A6A5XJK7_9PLEO|nr:6-phosphogluconate dehydrogenase C-terminal domain-like protein [Aaosphaeria arxii CBS 175.79]KAF2013007.1 6-phosphogluconate dehydrogenase C-terminal domain-like protein [Aaosphaeria arxii CBS 175.79]